MPSTRNSLMLLIAAAAVAILSFSVIGPYNMRIDGHIYVAQVEQFDAGTLVLEPMDVALRAFKPFYGIWGALLVPMVSPEQAIQFLNLLFLAGLPFAVYFFLREATFSETRSLLGALYVLCGYPVLKYGLAISTDIGGWVLSVLTAGFVLRGLRTASAKTLMVASVLGFIGASIKEPGLAGLIFGGVFLIVTRRSRPMRQTMKYLAALALPALILELVFLSMLVSAGLPTFLDWFAAVNTDEYHATYYTFQNFIGVEASTFNFLWLYAGIGMLLLWRRDSAASKRLLLIACFVATLPVLLWSIFISRVLYIQFLWVIPLALVGQEWLEQKVDAEGSTIRTGVIRMLPILCAISLFLLAGSQSLFSIFFS